MKLEVGKFYETRGRRKAEVVKRIKHDQFPFLVVVYGENGDDYFYGVTEDGYYSTGYIKPFDLVSEWREIIKVEKWVNLYRCKDGSMCTGASFDTKEEAVAQTADGCIATVRLTGEVVIDA